MNTKEFTDFCYNLNEDCIRRQDLEKELISDDNAFLAYAYIKNMSISDAGDVLLFCSCLNVLNTYVKQPNRKIGYAFKKELDYLVGLLLNIDIADVLVDLQKEGKIVCWLWRWQEFNSVFIMFQSIKRCFNLKK